MQLQGCAIFKNKDVTVYTNGEKLFYPAGESVVVEAESNTNGLWVLSPNNLKSIVLDGLK